MPISTLLPFISMFAVANSALINMLMASRLLYGMARQGVLPSFLGTVHRGRRTPWAAILFTTALAAGLIVVVSENAGGEVISALGGTTALLLLGVFTLVNVCVLVLRRDRIDRDHFTSPGVLPAVGALLCAFFVGPWTGRDGIQYRIAGWLLVVGVALWALTWLVDRAVHGTGTSRRTPDERDEPPGLGGGAAG